MNPQDRGLRALELLSYLAAAEAVTGDATFRATAERLRAEHGYGRMLVNAKIPDPRAGGSNAPALERRSSPQPPRHRGPLGLPPIEMVGSLPPGGGGERGPGVA